MPRRSGACRCNSASALAACRTLALGGPPRPDSLDSHRILIAAQLRRRTRPRSKSAVVAAVDKSLADRPGNACKQREFQHNSANCQPNSVSADVGPRATNPTARVPTQQWELPTQQWEPPTQQPELAVLVGVVEEREGGGSWRQPADDSWQTTAGSQRLVITPLPHVGLVGIDYFRLEQG